MRRGVETTVLGGVAAERFDGGVPFETEPTLPIYQHAEREVGSKPSKPLPGSRKIARALNIAVGLAIVALAAGAIVWYLGKGQPTTSVTTSAEQQAAVPDQPAAPAEPAPAQPVDPTVDQAAQKEKDKDLHASAKDHELAKASKETTPPETTPAAETAKTETKPVDSNPPVNVDHMKRGLELLNSGKYSQAVAEFNAAGRLQPANGDVHYLTAMAYEKMGRPADALSEYERCKSGAYAPLAVQHVKRLSKQLKK
jgi:tetratricopeptide (TPR) repeat protein